MAIYKQIKTHSEIHFADHSKAVLLSWIIYVAFMYCLYPFSLDSLLP